MPPIPALPANTTLDTNNPILLFMNAETSSSFFKVIGAPEILTNQRLIIYLLLILVCFLIVNDLLSTVNLFDKKWITSAISLIVILLGTYSGTMYNFIMPLLDFEFKSIFLASISPYLAFGVIGAYLVIRTIVKIIRRRGYNKEEVGAFGDKLETLKKIKKIEMKAEGID